MAQFTNSLSTDTEISGNRKIKILDIHINNYIQELRVKYQISFKTGGNSDLRINSKFPPAEFVIKNITRVTSTGKQFLNDNTRNPTFGVWVSYPTNGDFTAWNAATPEFDFIINKMVTASGAGAIDILDYANREIERLDSIGYFNI